MFWTRDHYRITTNPEEFDLRLIHQFLTSEAYWCAGVPVEVVQKAVENSLCFAVLDCTGDQTRQIGFARAVTDRATYAYLADVFILPAFRGRGLSKWLVACALSHPDLQGLRRIALATRDAHGLYRQFGFKALADSDMFMEIHVPDIYR